jgi:hypothetical protein
MEKTMPRKHTRIIQHPFAAGLQGAQVVSYHEEKHGQRLDVSLEYQAFEREKSELFERNGQVFEYVNGKFTPVRVRFRGVTELQSREYFFSLNALPPDEPACTLMDLLSWRQPERDDIFHLLSPKAADAPDLMFFAYRVEFERLPGKPIPASLERDWCPPPPMPAGLIPKPQAVHRQFGGDPVTVRIGAHWLRRRLFIGGTDIQPGERPQVDFVLNVGEEPSKWPNPDPNDRWDNKGEGRAGMSLEEIRQEAEWVAERLSAGQRVLVHCLAGMNRSSTICCAALMLLEGFSAEAALERVRTTHPWARPDSRHWLKLRWLGQTQPGAHN